jgi:hypothetical protein
MNHLFLPIIIHLFPKIMYPRTLLPAWYSRLHHGPAIMNHLFLPITIQIFTKTMYPRTLLPEWCSLHLRGHNLAPHPTMATSPDPVSLLRVVLPPLFSIEVVATTSHPRYKVTVLGFRTYHHLGLQMVVASSTYSTESCSQTILIGKEPPPHS